MTASHKHADMRKQTRDNTGYPDILYKASPSAVIGTDPGISVKRVTKKEEAKPLVLSTIFRIHSCCPILGGVDRRRPSVKPHMLKVAWLDL